MQKDGQELQRVCTNAKRMARSDGVWLQQGSALCSVSVACPSNDKVSTSSTAPSDDVPLSEFACVAGLAGKLLCVNKRLLDEPGLLWRRPHDAGYLAVLALSRKRHSEAIAQLAGYAAYAQQRAVPVELLKHCGEFGREEYLVVHPEDSFEQGRSHGEPQQA